MAVRAKKSEKFVLKEAGLSFPAFTRQERARLLARLKGAPPERRIRLLRIWRTEFFRHPRQLQWFRKELRTGLRILSIPCSSGEEVYTLGMILRAAGIEKFQLTGVDLDRENIRQAEAGLYSRSQVLKQVPLRYRKFGLKAAAGRGSKWFQVDGNLAKRTRWVHGNIFDYRPSGSTFDVVFCRNLFYYFESDGVLTALRRLHQMLAPRGFLVVSPSDKIPPSAQWKVVAPCVYQKV
jgi:chemotaxis methyl-accepting protein methylase